jgi:hypothetical protein
MSDGDDTERVFDNRSSWLFPDAENRQKDHVAHLWGLARLAADGEIDSVDKESFDRCLTLRKVGIGSLTIGLFWINPEKFLPADHKTTAYGKTKGVATDPEDYATYRQWLKQMTDEFGGNYPQVSHDAHVSAIGLGKPLNAIFTSRDEANAAFDLLHWTLTRLGIRDGSSDPRLALTLPRGNTPKMRLNFGNWAVLTFFGAGRGERRVQFLCRKDQVPHTAEYSPEGGFAEEIDGRVFTLAYVTLGRMQELGGAERAEFGESLDHVVKHFRDWNSSTWKEIHRPELVQMAILFEGFVRTFYRLHTEYNVKREDIYWRWIAADQVAEGLLPKMQTDISLVAIHP